MEIYVDGYYTSFMRLALQRWATAEMEYNYGNAERAKDFLRFALDYLGEAFLASDDRDVTQQAEIKLYYMSFKHAEDLYKSERSPEGPMPTNYLITGDGGSLDVEEEYIENMQLSLQWWADADKKFVCGDGDTATCCILMALEFLEKAFLFSDYRNGMQQAEIRIYFTALKGAESLFIGKGSPFGAALVPELHEVPQPGLDMASQVGIPTLQLIPLVQEDQPKGEHGEAAFMPVRVQRSVRKGTCSLL